MTARHRRVLRDWLDAPPHYRPWLLLNRMGFQLVRTLVANFRHRLRPAPRFPALAAYQEVLDRDGIVVIPDFLPSDAFAEVERAYAELGNSNHIRAEYDKGGTGVDWFTGRIDPGQERSAAEEILTLHIARNPVIRSLAEHVLRRTISRAPTLSYQRLAVRPEMCDDKDIECVLHADRHYPCVKVAYYMGENLPENGAYVFARGSHRVTPARLRHEYEYSQRQGKFIAGRGGLESALLERGRNKISDGARADMGIVEESIVGGKNTLVLSNNAGFHKRGTITPGKERKQIRILFYYTQRPWYGRLMARLLPKSD